MKKNTDPRRAIASARSSLIILLILTVVNILLLLFKSSSSFPYSLFFTYFASFVAYEAWMTEALLTVALLWGFAAFVELVLFLVAWKRSAKKTNWFLIAGILYLLDTAFMLWIYSLGGFDAAQIIDYLMHIWILYSLFNGWFAGKKQREFDQLVIIDQPLPEEVHPE